MQWVSRPECLLLFRRGWDKLKHMCHNASVRAWNCSVPVNTLRGRDAFRGIYESPSKRDATQFVCMQDNEVRELQDHLLNRAPYLPRLGAIGTDPAPYGRSARGSYVCGGVIGRRHENASEEVGAEDHHRKRANDEFGTRRFAKFISEETSARVCARRRRETRSYA